MTNSELAEIKEDTIEELHQLSLKRDNRIRYILRLRDKLLLAKEED